jgi:hypothetical protein
MAAPVSKDMIFTHKQRVSLAFALLTTASCLSVFAQQGLSLHAAHASNALNELRDKRRALLVVFRSRVFEVNDRERAIMEDVLKADPQPKGRNATVYNQLAHKLNNYVRKYKSLTAAEGLADADYIIYFNVVEYRKILNVVYPYGELFVIVKGSPEKLKPPRVVWRADKVLFADDAIGDLIRDLKAIRGES